MKRSIREMLSGGDRRSIGEADAVARLVLENPPLFSELLSAILDDDSIVRMRAADAVEKLTVVHPDWLSPHKRIFLSKVLPIDQQEVRWHVAQILPRFALNLAERKSVVAMLMRWIGHESSRIVRVMALQALFDLSRNDADLGKRVRGLLRELVDSDVPALRSRSRKLLKETERKPKSK